MTNDISYIEDVDLAEAISRVLSDAGVDSLEHLRSQAKAGRFESGRARRAWFVLANLVPAN